MACCSEAAGDCAPRFEIAAVGMLDRGSLRDPGPHGNDYIDRYRSRPLARNDSSIGSACYAIALSPRLLRVTQPDQGADSVRRTASFQPA